MSPRQRLVLFLLAAMCLLPAIASVARHMPDFGRHELPYGDAINAAAPVERHVTNMVSAVNFDYRGFDTLGEEFMLLCAVTGAVILLRGGRGEQQAAKPAQLPGRAILPRNDAVAMAARLFGPVTMLFGLYVVIHAMTTPGGGFQGGVIIGSGTLLVFLGDGYRSWRHVMPSPLLSAIEGGGATLYALCGFASLAAGLPFLQNFLPLGTLKSAYSGGLMLIENLGVAMAVAGGFGQLFLEFLEETRAPGPDEAA